MKLNLTKIITTTNLRAIWLFVSVNIHRNQVFRSVNVSILRLYNFRIISVTFSALNICHARVISDCP